MVRLLVVLVCLGCSCGSKGDGSKPEAVAAADPKDLFKRWERERIRVQQAHRAFNRVATPVAKACGNVPAKAITVSALYLDRLVSPERRGITEDDWIVAPIDAMIFLGRDKLKGLPLRDSGHLEGFRAKNELRAIADALTLLAGTTHLIVIAPETFLPEVDDVPGRLGAWTMVVALDQDAPPLCTAYVAVARGDVDTLVAAVPGALASGTALPPAPPAVATKRARRDVNGDQLDDILIANPDAGEVLLFRGVKGPPGKPQRITGGAGFGRAAALIGDMTGDGLADALVTDDANAVWLAVGSKQGLVLRKPALAVPEKSPPKLGAAVVALGDVNGDGLDDALVGGPGESPETDGDQDPELKFQGGAVLYRGARGPIVPDPKVIRSATHLIDFGEDLAGPGDINKDGYADAVLGRDSGGEVHYGHAEGLQTKATVMKSYTPLMSPAGDVDGDGYADVVVGRELRIGTARGLSEQASIAFGNFVFGVGDLDGDGAGELVRLLDKKIELYRGNLGRLPVNVATLDYPFEIPNRHHRLDRQAFPAGDVNGDGKLDFVLVLVDRKDQQRTLLFVGTGAKTLGSPIELAVR